MFQPQKIAHCHSPISFGELRKPLLEVEDCGGNHWKENNPDTIVVKS